MVVGIQHLLDSWGVADPLGRVGEEWRVELLEDPAEYNSVGERGAAGEAERAAFEPKPGGAGAAGLREDKEAELDAGAADQRGAEPAVLFGGRYLNSICILFSVNVLDGFPELVDGGLLALLVGERLLVGVLGLLAHGHLGVVDGLRVLDECLQPVVLPPEGVQLLVLRGQLRYEPVLLGQQRLLLLIQVLLLLRPVLGLLLDVVLPG